MNVITKYIGPSHIMCDECHLISRIESTSEAMVWANTHAGLCDPAGIQFKWENRAQDIDSTGKVWVKYINDIAINETTEEKTSRLMNSI